MAQPNPFRPVFSLSNSDVLNHAPYETHERHRHRAGFLAMVLEGGYTEVGDTGVWVLQQGDVIAHAPFEAHHNYVGSRGAKVLLLPLVACSSSPLRSVSDIDLVVRLASRCVSEAAQYVVRESDQKSQPLTDQIDLLAYHIRRDPSLRLDHWCETNGAAPAVVSRNFRKRFQCSAQQYRLASKVRLAIDAITRSDRSLISIAHECGFADQAHMSRAVHAHTGLTPTMLRKRAAPVEHLAKVGSGSQTNVENEASLMGHSL